MNLGTYTTLTSSQIHRSTKPKDTCQQVFPNYMAVTTHQSGGIPIVTGWNFPQKKRSDSTVARQNQHNIGRRPPSHDRYLDKLKETRGQLMLSWIKGDWSACVPPYMPKLLKAKENNPVLGWKVCSTPPHLKEHAKSGRIWLVTTHTSSFTYKGRGSSTHLRAHEAHKDGDAVAMDCKFLSVK